MKRKRTTRIKHFLRDNYRLLLFLLLPVSGIVCGMCLYPALRESGWSTLVAVEPIKGGFAAVLSQWSRCLFQPLLLLVVLFLAGLSVCGLPLSLLVPLFWGLGLGVVQAAEFGQGFMGLAVSAAVFLPHSVMETVALLMAAAECFRMSWRFITVLSPRLARCGGLWPEFRLYSVRYLLLCLLLFAAAALDVIMRLLCARWL